MNFKNSIYKYEFNVSIICMKYEYWVALKQSLASREQQKLKLFGEEKPKANFSAQKR